MNPLTDSRRDELADLLYETRKKKGMTPEEAAEKVKDPVWYAVMMMKAGLADGLSWREDRVLVLHHGGSRLRCR